MAMPAEITTWTAAMARALPDDGNRYEVLDGVLVVSPAPSWMHQRVVAAFLRRLDPYTRAHRLGDTLFSPADIEFSDQRLVQPDLFVVPLVEGRAPRAWTDVRELILALEVLSPSTSRVDRGEKRRIYLDERVPEYWIVHPESRLVERCRPDHPAEFTDTALIWEPVADVPARSIDLEELFEEVFGS
jgi:Uma2 family endonuclease